eukprot:TRINITY_DN2045_c0_g1_i2.p1 TRINITY_DN2045_c0_g1~~TRINITY_DN2045_c0_g1_i2.p1  ORF type:complete len:379 (+),score=61.44 TRINITY_DN2045_c0_g1_i2:535-1671(+)
MARAAAAYQNGLKADPTNAELKKALEDCEKLLTIEEHIESPLSNNGFPPITYEALTTEEEKTLIGNEMLEIVKLSPILGRGFRATTFIPKGKAFHFENPLISCQFFLHKQNPLGCLNCLKGLGSEKKEGEKSNWAWPILFCCQECEEKSESREGRFQGQNEEPSKQAKTLSLLRDYCQQNNVWEPALLARLYSSFLPQLRAAQAEGLTPEVGLERATRPLRHLCRVQESSLNTMAEQQKAAFKKELSLVTMVVYDPLLRPLLTLEKHVYFTTILKLNTFTISVSDTTSGVRKGEVNFVNGGGLYPIAAFCNHSCASNASWDFGKTNSLRLKAKEDIEAGQEITISYIDTKNLSTRERRERLRRAYLFECGCRLCSSAP